jgi:hypothetical protein
MVDNVAGLLVALEKNIIFCCFYFRAKKAGENLRYK